jgi:hypothetical protein
VTKFKEHPQLMECSPKTILDEAREIVDGARQKAYGPPEDNFKDIALAWGTFLGIKITGQQVAEMMILLKAMRLRGNPNHWDSLIDIAGYAYCASLLGTKDGKA